MKFFAINESNGSIKSNEGNEDRVECHSRLEISSTFSSIKDTLLNPCKNKEDEEIRINKLFNHVMKNYCFDELSDDEIISCLESVVESTLFKSNHTNDLKKKKFSCHKILSDIFNKTESFEKSLEEIRNALELYDDHNLKTKEGILLMRLGKYEEAIECFCSVINPQLANSKNYNQIAMNNLLMLNSGLMKIETTYDLCIHVLEKFPHDPLAIYCLKRIFKISENLRENSVEFHYIENVDIDEELVNSFESTLKPITDHLLEEQTKQVATNKVREKKKIHKLCPNKVIDSWEKLLISFAKFYLKLSTNDPLDTEEFLDVDNIFSVLLKEVEAVKVTAKGGDEPDKKMETDADDADRRRSNRLKVSQIDYMSISKGNVSRSSKVNCDRTRLTEMKDVEISLMGDASVLESALGKEADKKKVILTLIDSLESKIPSLIWKKKTDCIQSMIRSDSHLNLLEEQNSPKEASLYGQVNEIKEFLEEISKFDSEKKMKIVNITIFGIGLLLKLSEIAPKLCWPPKMSLAFVHLYEKFREVFDKGHFDIATPIEPLGRQVYHMEKSFPLLHVLRVHLTAFEIRIDQSILQKCDENNNTKCDTNYQDFPYDMSSLSFDEIFGRKDIYPLYKFMDRILSSDYFDYSTCSEEIFQLEGRRLWLQVCVSWLLHDFDNVHRFIEYVKGHMNLREVKISIDRPWCILHRKITLQHIQQQILELDNFSFYYNLMVYYREKSFSFIISETQTRVLRNPVAMQPANNIGLIKLMNVLKIFRRSVIKEINKKDQSAELVENCISNLCLILDYQTLSLEKYFTNPNDDKTIIELIWKNLQSNAKTLVMILDWSKGNSEQAYLIIGVLLKLFSYWIKYLLFLPENASVQNMSFIVDYIYEMLSSLPKEKGDEDFINSLSIYFLDFIHNLLNKGVEISKSSTSTLSFSGKSFCSTKRCQRIQMEIIQRCIENHMTCQELAQSVVCLCKIPKKCLNALSNLYDKETTSEILEKFSKTLYKNSPEVHRIQKSLLVYSKNTTSHVETTSMNISSSNLNTSYTNDPSMAFPYVWWSSLAEKNSHIDWIIYQALFCIFIPKTIPEYDSVKNFSISSDLKTWLEAGLILPPKKALNPIISMDVLEMFLEARMSTEQFNQMCENKESEPMISLTYYLIADYHHKCNNFDCAADFYLKNLLYSPQRFDSWAALALIYSNRIEEILNLTDSETETLSDSLVKRCFRCYQRAIEINSSAITLLIERGNLSYQIHSYASRMLKKVNDRQFSSDFLLTCNEWQKCMLNLTNSSFSLVQQIDQSKSQSSDDEWLFYYMAGKCLEKSKFQIKFTDQLIVPKLENEYPSEGLDKANRWFNDVIKLYQCAASSLKASGAKYPKKIVVYSKVPYRAVEAIEIYYRCHAFILKHLLSFPDPGNSMDNVEKTFLNLSNHWLSEFDKSDFIQIHMQKMKQKVQKKQDLPPDTDGDFQEVHSGQPSESSGASKQTVVVKDYSEYSLWLQCVLRCRDALEVVLQRLTLHYKSMYRLAFLYSHDNFPHKDYKLALSYLLGCSDNTLSQKGSCQGLFTQRKQNNFFHGVWRILTPDIDRSGNFAHHMYRSVKVLIELCLKMGKWKKLYSIYQQFKKPPNTDKRGFTSEEDRVFLSSLALKNICPSMEKWLIDQNSQANFLNNTPNKSKKHPISNNDFDHIYRLYTLLSDQKLGETFQTNLDQILIEAFKLSPKISSHPVEPVTLASVIAMSKNIPVQKFTDKSLTPVKAPVTTNQ